MDKKRLEKFIARYSIGGACDSVVYSVSDTGTLSTRGMSEDKNVVAEVSANNMVFPSGSYGVYDTSRLKSMLGVLSSDLQVTVAESNNRTVGLKFSDKNTEATFVLADVTIIPKVPFVDKFPLPDVTIVLDEQFINTFIRAKGALSEVDTFTVISDGNSKHADIVVGYSNMNTNRIKLSVETHEVAKLAPISFSAKYFREILVAHKDAGTGTLEVSAKGISRVLFESDEMTSVYYLLKIDN